MRNITRNPNIFEGTIIAILLLSVWLLPKQVLAWPPQLSGCGPNMGTPSAPIPGDPNGYKGWLDEKQEDAAGNKLDFLGIQSLSNCRVA